MFSHSVGYQFTLMIISFAEQKLLHLIRSHLSILAFVAIAFACHEVLYAFSHEVLACAYVLNGVA